MGWPSPHRSQRTARLRRRPREEGLGFSGTRFHPQPADLVFEFFHACTLNRGQGPVRFGILLPPRVHPAPLGPVVDLQVPGHLSDGLTSRDHHLLGLSLELRAELPAALWYRTDPLNQAENRCPRSLIHLNIQQAIGLQRVPSRGSPSLSSHLRWTHLSHARSRSLGIDHLALSLAFSYSGKRYVCGKGSYATWEGVTASVIADRDLSGG
jgi:hypothetical protein